MQRWSQRPLRRFFIHWTDSVRGSDGGPIREPRAECGSRKDHPSPGVHLRLGLGHGAASAAQKQGEREQDHQRDHLLDAKPLWKRLFSAAHAKNKGIKTRESCDEEQEALHELIAKKKAAEQEAKQQDERVTIETDCFAEQHQACCPSTKTCFSQHSCPSCRLTYRPPHGWHASQHSPWVFSDSLTAIPHLLHVVAFLTGAS